MPLSLHSADTDLAIRDRLMRQLFGRPVLLRPRPRRRRARVARQRTTAHLLPATHRRRLAVAQPGQPGDFIGRRVTAPEAVRA